MDDEELTLLHWDEIMGMVHEFAASGQSPSMLMRDCISAYFDGLDDVRNRVPTPKGPPAGAVVH